MGERSAFPEALRVPGGTRHTSPYQGMDGRADIFNMVVDSTLGGWTPADVGAKILEFPRKSIIFAQGVPAKTVFYIQQGGVKLSVVNEIGKEAVVAMLGPDDFFGEGCLAGQPIRIGMASAITQTTVLVIEKGEMIRLLHADREFSDRFVSYLLARNSRIEADLVDQLFNSTEKRLARALLLLARYQKENQRVIPRVSQETLAETIGTTRSRVNIFMNKFKRMGLIRYNGGLQIDSSLLVRFCTNKRATTPSACHEMYLD